MWTYLQTMVYEVLVLSHAWLFVTPWIVLSCLTLRDPVDYSLPGFLVHRILQARVLEWIAIPFFRVSSWPRDLLHCRQIFYCLSHRGSQFIRSYTQKSLVFMNIYIIWFRVYRFKNFCDFNSFVFIYIRKSKFWSSSFSVYYITWYCFVF